MKKKKVVFNWVSERTNDRDLYTLEPVESGYESPFNPTDENELSDRLDEFCELYERLMNIPVEYFEATMLLPYDGRLEARPLQSGVVADDVKDIRRTIELPEGVAFEDCRFFVLCPCCSHDREHPEAWLVLRPQTALTHQ